MKKMLTFVAAMFFAMAQLWSQSVTKPKGVSEDRNFRVPLIGETAPSFTAESTNGIINFPDDYGRHWKILFSHPADFTPVCSTEILEMASLHNELDKAGIKLVVVSTDALETHIQWKKSLETLDLNNKGTMKITFPLVDDNQKVIAKKYGMIHPSSNTTKAVRGVFVIDPQNVIQAIYFYPPSVGRNTDELLRVVEALQETSSGNVLTPVNWKAGNDFLVPVPPKTDAAGKALPAEGFYSPIWYLWFKQNANQAVVQ